MRKLRPCIRALLLSVFVLAVVMGLSGINGDHPAAAAPAAVAIRSHANGLGHWMRGNLTWDTPDLSLTSVTEWNWQALVG